MPDGTNPVLDKELRSEIFAQGTLMLRLVIQVSMLLSIPLMAFLLFFKPQYAGYYVAYVLTFNMLVGPVFSSGSITQERERQDACAYCSPRLLRPGQIVFAKLVAALRGLDGAYVLAHGATPPGLRSNPGAAPAMVDPDRVPR